MFACLNILPTRRISNDPSLRPLLSLYIIPSFENEHPMAINILDSIPHFNIPHSPPPPLLALTPELKESLERKAKATLFQILAKLLSTIFFNEAPALATLRNALGDGYSPLLPDGSENYELLFKFFSCIPLTTYEDYRPFVARLLDTEFPKLSDVNNLLSPGLPAYIAHSSGTSGGGFKYFPKYPIPNGTGLRWDSPDVPGYKLCRFTFLHLNRWKQLVDDDSRAIQGIPLTIESTGRARSRWGIGPEDDAKIIDKKGRYANFLLEI